MAKNTGSYTQTSMKFGPTQGIGGTSIGGTSGTSIDWNNIISPHDQLIGAHPTPHPIIVTYNTMVEYLEKYWPALLKIHKNKLVEEINLNLTVGQSIVNSIARSFGVSTNGYEYKPLYDVLEEARNHIVFTTVEEKI